MPGAAGYRARGAAAGRVSHRDGGHDRAPGRALPRLRGGLQAVPLAGEQGLQGAQGQASAQRTDLSCPR